MATTIELERMTTDEKLRLLEVVWQDLNRTPDTVPAPAWHGSVLEDRDRKLKEGKSRLNDWSKSKQRIREQAG